MYMISQSSTKVSVFESAGVSYCEWPTTLTFGEFTRKRQEDIHMGACPTTVATKSSRHDQIAATAPSCCYTIMSCQKKLPKHGQHQI